MSPLRYQKLAIILFAAAFSMLASGINAAQRDGAHFEKVLREEFAAAVFSIWLGSKPINKSFKKQILGLN